VVFVINPTDADTVARVALGSEATWSDLLERDGGTTRSAGGVLELRMRPQAVRMLGRC